MQVCTSHQCYTVRGGNDSTCRRCGRNFPFPRTQTGIHQNDPSPLHNAIFNGEPLEQFAGFTYSKSATRFDPIYCVAQYACNSNQVLVDGVHMSKTLARMATLIKYGLFDRNASVDFWWFWREYDLFQEWDRLKMLQFMARYDMRVVWRATGFTKAYLPHSRVLGFLIEAGFLDPHAPLLGSDSIYQVFKNQEAILQSIKRSVQVLAMRRADIRSALGLNLLRDVDSIVVAYVL